MLILLRFTLRVHEVDQCVPTAWLMFAVYYQRGSSTRLISGLHKPFSQTGRQTFCVVSCDELLLLQQGSCTKGVLYMARIESELDRHVFTTTVNGSVGVAKYAAKRKDEQNAAKKQPFLYDSKQQKNERPKKES